MSNGINNNDPNRLNQTHFGQPGRHQHDQTSEETAPEAQAAPTPGKNVDPSAVFKFLSQQGNLNQGAIENVPIAKSMAAFQTAISMDRHQHLFQTFRTTYQEEFGSTPSDAQVQEALDDYLIGVPVYNLS